MLEHIGQLVSTEYMKYCGDGTLEPLEPPVHFGSTQTHYHTRAKPFLVSPY